MRVRIDREQCISCCNCSTECPEVFEHSPDDGWSQILTKYRVSPDKFGEGDVPESLRGCVQTAADICPVQIIHVED